MKILATAIITLLFSQNCRCQQRDTIRIYVFSNPGDSWRLSIKNNTSFTLTVDDLLPRGKNDEKGDCIMDDSTIQFICDTSKLNNRNLTHDVLRKYSNIPYILCGDKFSRKGNFFIPRTLSYFYDSKKIMPAGMYATFAAGEGFGGSVYLELREDSTYQFSEVSCISGFKEKGAWTLDNGILSLHRMDGKWSMLDWFTSWGELYVTENYLVGRKTKNTRSKTGKKIVTEYYYYLSKEPNYVSE